MQLSKPVQQFSIFPAILHNDNNNPTTILETQNQLTKLKNSAHFSHNNQYIFTTFRNDEKLKMLFEQTLNERVD